MLVFNGSMDNQFRVAINDILPSSYTSLTVNLLSGTATVSGSTIFYTPATGASADTLQYRIHCGNAQYADTATVYIKIMDNVDNIGDAECFVEPPSVVWSFSRLAESPVSVNHYVVPLVGDIDNDGKIEIVTGGNSGGETTINQIIIFEVDNNSLSVQQTLTIPNIMAVGSPVSIANVDGGNYAAIFICTEDAHNGNTDKMQLIKYTYDDSQLLYVENARVTYSSVLMQEMGQPMFADFNGDDIPEVVVMDKVWNARTMTLLADGDYLASYPVNGGHDSSTPVFGLGMGGHRNNNTGGTTARTAPFMAIADMDNDGIPEVIGGNTVYKVTINNPADTYNNSFIAWSQCDGIGPDNEFHPEVRDGATAVADMDGDGFLDVIVTVSKFRIDGNSDYYGTGAAMYVWNPRTGHVMHSNKINALEIGPWFGPSRPFVGDVDNDGQPEIAFTVSYNMYCFEYNKTEKLLEEKWKVGTGDESGSTTMSLFDFDMDGNAELVYRDASELRIINGTTGDNNVIFGGLQSHTANECPIVANVTSDKSAEIIVTGGDRLHIFSSNPPGQWASARSVWNQFSYNSVNINEDLTVPAVQMNPATVFPGPDGQLGTSDDIRPYNNFLQQQTALSKNGTPYWETADYAIEGVPTAIFYPVDDSLVISFSVKNYGDIQGSAPLFVTIYQNARQDGNAFLTQSYPDVPAAGETLHYSIKVENVTTSGLNSLHLWLNDSGNGTNADPECDYTNGVVVYDVTGTVVALNDYASVFACEEVAIPILANDEYAGTTFTVLNTPKYGTVVQSGGGLKYANSGGTLPCAQTGNQLDTVHYRIESVISYDEAYAVIKIYSLPEMMLENACSPNPKIVLSNGYEGFTYDWEYSQDGASGWTFVSMGGDSMELNIANTTAGFYRLTINYEGDKKYQLKQGVEVVTNRTTLLRGGIVW
jgi:hypothetical protein